MAVEDGLRDVGGEIAEADQPREIRPAHAFLPSQCGKGAPGLPTRAALKRCALFSSLISRALGLAMAHGSLLSITILISRPEQRSRIGTDKIWIS